MLDKTKLRYIVIIFLFLSLIALTCAFTIRENNTCLGVKIEKNPKLHNSQEIFVNLGDLFFLDDAKAAVSEGSKTIYISQNVDELTSVCDLDGILSLASNDYSLIFVYDDMFGNLQKAISENHKFTLMAVKDYEYIKYNVVFTTLPVISIDGSVIGTNEDNREIFLAISLFGNLWTNSQTISEHSKAMLNIISVAAQPILRTKKALSFL